MVGRIREIGKELRAVVAMVAVQTAYAGMNMMFKLAADDGMTLRILAAYRLLFATLFMLPLALIFERKKRPEFTWRLLSLAFLSGLLGGALPSNLALATLSLTSATFSTAISILIPLVTFVMSVVLRMENLRLRSSAGKAKAVGTMLGIGGTLVFILYKGVEIPIWSTHFDLLHHHRRSGNGHVASSCHPTRFSIWGALMGLGCNICYSSWLLLQVKISKEIQGQYWNTALMCVMGSLQSVVFALCTVRDWKQWRLGWNIRLLSSAYTGIVVSGMVSSVIAWCVQLKGPLFVSTFSPVGLIIIALVGSFALEEPLHLGSIIATVMIVGGVYLVLWGKNKEMKAITLSLDRIEMSNNHVNKDIITPNNHSAININST